MLKNPLNYTKEDIGEIINIPLIIDVGLLNSDEVTETIEGQIISCTLAANPPHLPATIRIELKNGKLKVISLFNIKSFRKI